MEKSDLLCERFRTVCRVGQSHREMDEDPDFLKNRVVREKSAWDLFYDVMDQLEMALSQKDTFALELKKKAEILIRDCAVHVGRSD